MTDDLAALLDHLNTGPVNVLGWSDAALRRCCSASGTLCR